MAIISSPKPISPKYQKATTLSRHQNSLYWTSSPELDYWFTCVLSAEVWCNFLVISQVFVCSQPLLHCFLFFFCAVQWQEEPTHDLLCLLFFCRRVGGQFLLNGASFKSIQLWLEIKIMIHWINHSVCICLIVDKQIRRKKYWSIYFELIIKSICGGSSIFHCVSAWQAVFTPTSWALLAL